MGEYRRGDDYGVVFGLGLFFGFVLGALICATVVGTCYDQANRLLEAHTDD